MPTTALLNVRMVPLRMLTDAEAASHCGRAVKRFKAECPVTPVKFPNGDLRWDIRDLDAWIDGLKGLTSDADDIVGKLE